MRSSILMFWTVDQRFPNRLFSSSFFAALDPELT
jgi:hypothetical protein